MFSDDKMRKILEDIPDRIENGIKELNKDIEEFDRGSKERKKRMADARKEMEET